MELVYIVGVAEVIRQIAIAKYHVAQDHAAIIWIIAIYMLAQLWARASNTPDL